MPLKRPFKIVLIATALVVVAIAALLWIGGRTSFARNLVAQRVSEATGLPTTVESLTLGFLRGPSIELHGLAVAQPAGFGDEPLIEVGRARITAPWSSLFGDPVAHGIAIEKAVLRPRVKADGSDNWSAMIDHLTSSGEETAAPAWGVGRLEVSESVLDYDDASTKTRFRLSAITVAASDVSPAADFPVELRLGGESGKNTFLLAFDGRGLADTGAGRFAVTALNLRGWAGGEPLPLAGVELKGEVKALTFDGETSVAAVEGAKLNLAGIPGEFAGSLDIARPEATLITFRTGPFAPRAPAVAFGKPLPRTKDEKAFGSFQIAVEGRIKDGVLHLDPIEGRLDETSFNGRLVPSARLVRLNADRIEVDRYLSPETNRRIEKKATLEAAIAELAEYDIDAEIRVGEARVAGARLRDTVIRVERNGKSGK